jgi:thiosulfate reductase cytochrome b subunit
MSDATDGVPRKTRMGVPSGEPASTPPDTPPPTRPTRMGAPPAASASSPVAGPSAAPATAPAASASTASVRTVSTSAIAVPVPRVTRKRVMVASALVVVAVVAVLVARWLRTTAGVESFLETYPGHPTLPADVPIGLPAWLGWQHYLNFFFLVLIVRSGLSVRWERRAPASWAPRARSFFSPPASTSRKVSLTQFVHQSLDVLWVINGLVFVVLLFVTGQWMRIVPTHWDVIPNAVSAALQYASLDWPVENGWTYYNALQLLAYFVTVFVATPLAVISGLRLSTWWPDQNARIARLYPVEIARAIHFPVMIYFVLFTAVHVFLVFFTGALRNLNHIYTSRDVVDGWGLAVFVASLVVIAVAWLLTRPLFMRAVASRFGTVSK